MNYKRRLIIDTDPGHDDALAIMMIEKSQKVFVEAITTVAGNSDIQNTTNNARYILDLIGSYTPLYSGEAKPLKRKLVQADVHGSGGLEGVKVTKKVKLTGNAVEEITKLIKENPGEITILELGPCTNIAKAFLLDRELSSLVKEIVIMGGAIRVPGNKNRVAEFNFFVDPEAADVVLKAPVKKILVPLDVCNDISLTPKDFRVLRDTKIYNSVTAMVEAYIQGIQKFEKTQGALMYDVLAGYYLINPGAYKTAAMDVQIETEGNLTRGMSVAERRKWGDNNPNVDVVTEIDSKVFKRDFFNILRLTN